MGGRGSEINRLLSVAPSSLSRVIERETKKSTIESQPVNHPMCFHSEQNSAKAISWPSAKHMYNVRYYRNPKHEWGAGVIIKPRHRNIGRVATNNHIASNNIYESIVTANIKRSVSPIQLT